MTELAIAPAMIATASRSLPPSSFATPSSLLSLYWRTDQNHGDGLNGGSTA
jgi:hypothetical protein